MARTDERKFCLTGGMDMRNRGTTHPDISSAKRSGETEKISAFRLSDAVGKRTTSAETDCYLQYHDGGLAQQRNLKGRGVTRVGRSYRAECGINRPGMAGICVEFRKCGNSYVLQNVSAQSSVSVNNIPLPFGKYRRVKVGDKVSLPGVKLEIVRGVCRPLVEVSYQENPEVRRVLAERMAM